MEKYLAIIRILDNGVSITQDQILRKINVKLTSPKETLNFLVKLDIIVEKPTGNRVTYSITDKGKKLHNYFMSKDDESIFDGTNISRID